MRSWGGGTRGRPALSYQCPKNSARSPVTSGRGRTEDNLGTERPSYPEGAMARLLQLVGRGFPDGRDAEGQCQPEKPAPPPGLHAGEGFESNRRGRAQWLWIRRGVGFRVPSSNRIAKRSRGDGSRSRSPAFAHEVGHALSLSRNYIASTYGGRDQCDGLSYTAGGVRRCRNQGGLTRRRNGPPTGSRMRPGQEGSPLPTVRGPAR